MKEENDGQEGEKERKQGVSIPCFCWWDSSRWTGKDLPTALLLHARVMVVS